MTEILIIASKEITDGLRNRWIVIVTLLMIGLALVLAFLGSVPTGTTKISQLSVSIVSLSSLSVFFVPLIALLLTYDSIVAESDRGTLMLLLTHPVARWQVIFGKFIGHLALLSVAIAVGYSIAGLVIAGAASQDLADQAWSAYARMIASSILLGAVFLALGLMISSYVRDRGTAAGIAIGVWLLFVLIYDLGVLALLAAGTGELLGDSVILSLLLANPADAYRMFNLTGSSETAILSGMAGLTGADAPSHGTLLALLIAWAFIPLAAACFFFGRRQI